MHNSRINRTFSYADTSLMRSDTEPQVITGQDLNPNEAADLRRKNDILKKKLDQLTLALDV
jgi:hypothetical protein